MRLAIQYLRDGRNTQAFALLSAMEDSENPTAVFALALCYLRAGEFPAAIALEFYLWKIKRGTSV